jgi:hypothetical protein
MAAARASGAVVDMMAPEVLLPAATTTAAHTAAPMAAGMAAARASGAVVDMMAPTAADLMVGDGPALAQDKAALMASGFLGGRCQRAIPGHS